MGRGQAARQRLLVPSFAGSNPAVPAFFGGIMNQRQLACVILAAGNGTRMKSNYPKVLTPFYEKPILEHIIEKAEKVNPAQIVVVVSPQYETLVREQFSTRITVAVQTKPLRNWGCVTIRS